MVGRMTVNQVSRLKYTRLEVVIDPDLTLTKVVV